MVLIISSSHFHNKGRSSSDYVVFPFGIENITIIPGTECFKNSIVSRYVEQISDNFTSNTNVLIFLVLLALILAVIQVSPLSIYTTKLPPLLHLN